MVITDLNDNTYFATIHLMYEDSNIRSIPGPAMRSPWRCEAAPDFSRAKRSLRSSRLKNLSSGLKPQAGRFREAGYLVMDAAKQQDASSELVALTVKQVLDDGNTDTRIVVLKSEDAGVTLPIWVGSAEGNAIRWPWTMW